MHYFWYSPEGYSSTVRDVHLLLLFCPYTLVSIFFHLYTVPELLLDLFTKILAGRADIQYMHFIPCCSYGPMDNPDLFLNNLLPEICIFNAVITSAPFPDFFSLNFYGCSAQIYA